MVLCNIINSLTGFKFPYVKGLILFFFTPRERFMLIFCSHKGIFTLFMIYCIYILFINLVCRLIREIKFFSSSFVFFST